MNKNDSIYTFYTYHTELAVDLKVGIVSTVVNTALKTIEKDTNT